MLLDFQGTLSRLERENTGQTSMENVKHGLGCFATS